MPWATSMQIRTAPAPAPDRPAPIGAGRSGAGAGAVRICIEVAQGIRLHDFEAVNRCCVHAIILVEAVLRDLLGIDVVDEQAATAWRHRRSTHLNTVIANHRAVGL